MADVSASCPTCGADIVECDNSVWLDRPAVPYDEITAQWTLMRLGSMIFASVGDRPRAGFGHALHEHQPPEGSMQ